MAFNHQANSSSNSETGPKRSWTILSLLEWSAEYLKDRKFEDPRLNAELLLCHMLGLQRIQLYTNFDRPLTSEELARFKELFQRRLRHEPLQYIVGETEFMGLKFFVDQSVLIPRPETEVLLEHALDAIRTSGKENVTILDVGTGAGNMAVALAHFAHNAVVTAIDVSQEALQTASRNLARHSLNTVTLLHIDMFSDFLTGRFFDIIVSNPPYVSADEFEILPPEVRDFEPKIATCDGSDGFRFIKRICAIAAEKLASGGILFMEIAYNQSAGARSIAEASGLQDIELYADHAGILRVLKAGKAEGK